MPGFGLSAFIQSGFVDDKDDVAFVDAPQGPLPISVISDFSGFTADATDPDPVRDFAGDSVGSYSGWLGLEVTKAGFYRLFHYLEADGMSDTQMGIWGPRATPPGASDDPYHFSDDSVPGGYLASLHHVGSDPLGTLWDGGAAYSEDDQESGIWLEPGQYWVHTAPYDDTSWDTSEGPVRLSIQYLPTFSLSAVIAKTQTGYTYPDFPEYVSADGNANWGQPSISLPRPAGVANGQLLVAVLVGQEGGTARTLTSAGWTQRAYIHNAGHTNHTVWVFTKTASSEPTSWTWTWGSGTGSLSGGVMVFEDAVFGGYAENVTNSGSTSHSTAGLSDVLGIAVAAFAGSAFGPTSTWTLDTPLTEVFQDTDFFTSIALGYEVVDPEDDVGPYTATTSNSTPRINVAYFVGPIPFEGLSLDAIVGPGFFLSADIAGGARRLGYLPLRAVILSKSFTLAAEIIRREFTVGAYIANGGLTFDAVILGTAPANATVLSAYIAEVVDPPGPPVTKSGALYLRAYKAHAPAQGGFSIGAVMDSAIGMETFTIDATYVEPTRFGSFGVGSEISPEGEEHGLFTVGSMLMRPSEDSFSIEAHITKMTVGAWIAGGLGVDAVLAYAEGLGAFTTDAVVKSGQIRSISASAIVSDAAGDIRQSNLDAVLLGTVQPYGGIELLAKIVATMNRSFGVNAVLNPGFGVEAFVQPYFSVGAYIESTSVVVYPPSQDGVDGTSTDGTTFYSPSADFDPSLVGQQITVGDQDFIITAVVDGNTLTVSGSIPFGQNDLVWFIGSGEPTDPVGGPPPITRKFRVTIEWSRPNKNRWTEITGDVIWAPTKFTQTARIGPGTFELHLKGTFPQFVGGEEIRVSVDDFRVFGGYVLEIEEGYAFDDDLGTPLTVLHGVDYNIVLDRQLVYNAEWDRRQGGDGEYRPWRSFPTGTSDREIIRTIARRFSSDLVRDGFDFISGVDEITTPAPVTRWTMETGSTWRTVLAEISRITEGVFWISPYKRLEYHDRGEASAPYPITDGNSGISCRGLVIGSHMSVVSNDVFAWGTAAYLDTGDSEIIFSRQTSDQAWEVDWYQRRIDRVDSRLATLRQTPFNKRTKKQQTEIAALKKAREVYVSKRQHAINHPTDGSVERIGRWQYAEFRQDIYQQGYLDKRARAIMDRYSQPVVRGKATVFDPGFQAGQVVEVVSTRFRAAEDVAIREMTIDFVVAKEPVGGRYYAVPRYNLSLGLDPEDPWDIYQFLPFPDLDLDIAEGGGDPYTNYNAGRDRTGGGGGVDATARVLDTYTRVLPAGSTWGVATSERSESREWKEELSQGFIIFADDFERTRGPFSWPETNPWGSPWFSSGTGGHPGTGGVDGSRGYITAPSTGGQTLQINARSPIEPPEPASKWQLYWEAQLPLRSTSPGVSGLPNGTAIILAFYVDDEDENTVYETTISISAYLEDFQGNEMGKMFLYGDYYDYATDTYEYVQEEYQIGTGAGLDFLEAPYAMRAEADASGIRAKVWSLAGSEPSEWQLQADWSGFSMMAFPPAVVIPPGHSGYAGLIALMDAFNGSGGSSYLDNVEWKGIS